MFSTSDTCGMTPVSRHYKTRRKATAIFAPVFLRDFHQIMNAPSRNLL